MNPEKDLSPWVSPTCLGLHWVEGLQGHSRGALSWPLFPSPLLDRGGGRAGPIPRTCSCVLCFLDSASPLPYSCLDPSHSPTPFLLLSPQQMMVSDAGPSWPSPGGLTKPHVHGEFLAEPPSQPHPSVPRVLHSLSTSPSAFLPLVWMFSFQL